MKKNSGDWRTKTINDIQTLEGADSEDYTLLPIIKKKDYAKRAYMPLDRIKPKYFAVKIGELFRRNKNGH